jgi:hypothetical protein
MRKRVFLCSVAAAAVSVAALVPVTAQGEVLGASARAAASPKAAVRGVPVKSKYETKTRVISRDGGVSVGLPDGHMLWIFGDTGIYTRSGSGPWRSSNFIDGSTALITTAKKGVVPSGNEVPGGVPKRFIPVPNNVYLPNGSGKKCTYATAAFPARWPTGATMLSRSQALITYSIVCVTTPHGHATTQAEGWGYLLYNWKTHKISHGPVDVFKPSKKGTKIALSKIYSSPSVSGGVVTMYASQCVSQVSIGCKSGRVWSVGVRATSTALDKAANYKPVPLTPAAGTTFQPLSISVGRYNGTLKIVALATITGDYRIYSAPVPSAPWSLAKSGKLPGCPSKTGFCFALEGHPELSPSTSTFVSYKNPDAGPGGHIVVSAIPN